MGKPLNVNLAGLKICFIAGTLGQGGAERQLYYLLRCLMENDSHVDVLCLGQSQFWETRIRALGVTVENVESASRLPRLKQITERLSAGKPDIIQSQHFYTNFYAAAAGRILNIRNIGAMRNNGASEVKDCGRISGWLNLRAPRILAANSNAAIRYACRRGIAPGRICLLPNVVEVPLMISANRDCKREVRVLCAGRLEPQKRIDRFLRVFAAVVRSTTARVKGIIVGSGTLETALRKQAEEAGLLPHHVEFWGAQPDMHAVYEQCDLLALTSDYEGTPNVVLEAMAHGLPVVSTNVGGVPDIIEQGETGFLVDPTKEQQFADAVSRLVGSAEMRRQFGCRGRVHVARAHSVESLPTHLGTLYRLALS